MLPTAGAQIRALVLFLLSSGSVATPLPLYSSFEGSTDEDDYSVFPSSLPTIFLLTEYRTTPVGSTVVKTDLLSQVANFLEENMLLILVASSFFLLFFLIVCGAIFMSQRRKVNAYYPSSYPTKMYVDQRDKTGGAKVFDDVPEKAAPEQEREAVDSHRQLQDEIMKAARSLRTPTKPAAATAAEGKENSQRAAELCPEDEAEAPCGSFLEQQLSSFPEEEEGELGEDKARAAAEVNTEPISDQPKPQEDDSEQLHPDKDDSQAPPTGRNLRPSSLHIHNDSATLQLIAGEKTAF